jgi:hypothetical protein
MKHRLTNLFFVVGFLFAILSLPSSAALSKAMFERKASFKVASDLNATLKLNGFDGKTVNKISKHYKALGSVTNNSNETIELTVTIRPDFSEFKKKFYWFGIKIGDEIRVFEVDTPQVQQVTLELVPGQMFDVQLGLQRNQSNDLVVSFDFTAVAKSGTFNIQLYDTDQTPRRIIVT